jgi:hypothetical protein
MLDIDKATAEFQRALRALSAIIRSRNASPEQKEAAKAARADLSLKFTQQAIEAIDERTVLFQEFITAMENIINEIGRDSPLEGLKTLTKIVDDSKDLLAQVEKAKEDPA